ncbi:MAG: hypothetical protein ACPGJS_18200 [Flammeovirgaceae bacterium]
MALKGNENRTIVLPILESDYSTFMNDPTQAHEMISQYYQEFPALFPEEMSTGYCLNGKTRLSKKTGIQMRKISISGISYRIRPSYLLPYLRGKTQDASNGLFLLRFGVPFWALAVVFGRNAMWWYRLYAFLGRYSIVQTSVSKGNLPEDILADEHHIRIKGKKAYVATTVAKGCFIGMEVSSGADEKSLTNAYGVFKQEALEYCTDYKPSSVNTDGWKSTQNAWKTLFPTILVIECFLHAFIKVRDRATKKLQSYFELAADKIWDCYRAESVKSLAQQIRRLREWTTKHVPDSAMKNNILKLCLKKDKWIAHFQSPQAFRTSNMLDRLMRAMDRHAYNSQMFHSTIKATTLNFRAFAMIYNFAPSAPKVCRENPKLESPMARLNGFVYHNNWLHNLLIATSNSKIYHHRKAV